MTETSMLPDIITRARARPLIRAPFFGSIALGLEWIAEAAIRTMATDGHAVWFHTSWCEAQGVEKTMGVVVHEVLHVVNKHHLRRRNRDVRLWNIACDLFIRILLADNWLLPDTLLFDREGRFAGLPAEVIYERLLDEWQREGNRGNDEQQVSIGTQGDTGSDQNGRRGGQGIEPAESWGEVRDLTAEGSGKLTEGARRQAEDDLDVRIRQAVAAAKRAGRFGGALHEVVEAALDRVDWRNRLRTLFDGTMRGEASWAKPNRRFLPHGLYLPGWRRAGAGRVAFVLDTSGSISARELAIYAANLLGIIEETGPEQIAARPVRYGGQPRRVSRAGRKRRTHRGRGPRRHAVSAGVRLDRHKRVRAERHPLRHRPALRGLPGRSGMPGYLADADPRPDHAIRRDRRSDAVRPAAGRA
jgi:predicted metal-dependent peptidase